MKSTSSSPWISVNYFEPLAIEDYAKSETVPKTPPNQKGETKQTKGPEEQKSKDPQVEKSKCPDKLREESAEWVVWMMHQDTRKGERVLGHWTHLRKKSEVT